jgi:hypothetical protein
MKYIGHPALANLVLAAVHWFYWMVVDDPRNVCCQTGLGVVQVMEIVVWLTLAFRQ